jgi:predicted TPR repeat methyltransferase
LRKCRAELRRRMGDRTGAAKDAAEAVILDPGDPRAKAILGQVMLNLRRTADAIECLTESVAIAPADLGYREMLAAALETSGDPDAALRVLTDGISLYPANVSLHNAAISLCVRRHDFSKALRLVEMVQAIGHADACTFGMKGHAMSGLGRHDEATSAYMEALKLGSDDPYVRHLVVSSGALPAPNRASEGYVRAAFDDDADGYDSQLVALDYSLPLAIRSLLLTSPMIGGGFSVGPVLELGCGTGLIAMAIGDLPVGPFTGVDLSPRMLSRARAKQLYAELRESDLVLDLATHRQRWPLIIAADVLCYFGALEELLSLIQQRLKPGGWFVFSVEEIRPDHDGVVPANGRWVLQRHGRYAHAEDYVCETVHAAGLRIARMERLSIRQEAIAPVPGLLFAVEQKTNDR